jgi:hypothetical protein
VGEQVVPLARYFNDNDVDVESGTAAMVCQYLKKITFVGQKENNMSVHLDDFCICFYLFGVYQDKSTVELKSVATPPKDELRRGALTSQKDENRKYGNSRELIANKYAVRKQSNPVSIEPSTTSVSLLEPNMSDNMSSNSTNVGPRNGLASTWANMKSGFQNFKENMNSRKFLPLRQSEPGPTIHTRASSSESLDEIFKRLNKRPNDGNDVFDIDHDK